MYMYMCRGSSSITWPFFFECCCLLCSLSPTTSNVGVLSWSVAVAYHAVQRWLPNGATSELCQRPSAPACLTGAGLHHSGFAVGKELKPRGDTGRALARAAGVWGV